MSLREVLKRLEIKTYLLDSFNFRLQELYKSREAESNPSYLPPIGTSANKKFPQRPSIVYEIMSTLKPSEVVDQPWLRARRLTGDYPKLTDNSGKWLVFVPMPEIDKVWEKIKRATEEGLLGGSSKVSTAYADPFAKNANKVICAYTYDWTDEKDVRRIRDELRTLGIKSKIPYKADDDTLAGKYKATGHARISKYYE